MGEFSGENLRFTILSSGVSQTDLAKHLGIGLTSLQSYYRAKNVKADTWTKIMSFINEYKENSEDSYFDVINEPPMKYEVKANCVSPITNTIENLERIAKLREKNYITETEYENLKRKILNP